MLILEKNVDRGRKSSRLPYPIGMDANIRIAGILGDDDTLQYDRDCC